jgi:hypothetical protein
VSCGGDSFDKESEVEAVVFELEGVDEEEEDDDEEDEVEEEEEEGAEEEEEEGAEEEEEEEGPVGGPFSLSSVLICASHECRPLSVGNSLLTTTMTLSELLVIISITCEYVCD